LRNAKRIANQENPTTIDDRMIAEAIAQVVRATSADPEIRLISLRIFISVDDIRGSGRLLARERGDVRLIFCG
jgi:hypothetical protein